MIPSTLPNSTAAAMLAEIEVSGVHATLRDGKLVLAPGARLGPDLRDRVKATLKPLIALLRSRCEAERGRAPAPEGRPGPSCELRRFPDWNPVQVVRFCCEPAHAHADGVPTYDAQEVEVVLEWCSRSGTSRLPIPLRNLVLDLKVMFGGRIDGTTLDDFGSAR